MLLAFDGTPIANDGTVPFRARERIFFTSLITLKATGSSARVRVRKVGVGQQAVGCGTGAQLIQAGSAAAACGGVGRQAGRSAGRQCHHQAFVFCPSVSGSELLIGAV